MYKISIVQLTDENDSVPMPRYEQIVDQLDLLAVINAVNQVHTATNTQPRKRAMRSDAGKPRRQDDAARSMDNPPPVEADPFG
jgi:hypothetical protein